MNSNLRAKAKGKGLAIRIEKADSEPWYRATIHHKLSGRWLRVDAENDDLIASIIEDFDGQYEAVAGERGEVV